MKILSRSSSDTRHASLTVPLNEFRRYQPIHAFQPAVLVVEVLPSGPTTILRISEGALRRRGNTMYSLLSPSTHARAHTHTPA
jgi:hypothetical protein